VSILVDETVVYNTRKRVPYKIVIETIEYKIIIKEKYYYQ